MEPKSQALEESTLWHSLPVTEVEARLQSDHTVGLSSEDVRERQLRLGENKLPASRSVPWLLRLLSQFNQLLIWILFLAAIFSGYLGDWGEAVAILGIVLLNGLLGFFQEIRAERSIQALQQLTAPLARVRRGGRQCLVPAAELVPGDTVELEAGDKLPADCRVVSAFSVSVDEASLTGESVTVSKSAEELAPATPLVDRRNMFYSGTVVTSGKATAIVVATGVRTELGKIANLLESEPWKETPLQKRLRELGRVLLFACLAIVAVIFGLQLLRGGQILETLLFSISLAVAAVPEGLPVVVTVTLSIGLQRMAKRNAIIRSLPSVETLGSVSTICSDKTGTLTRNQMTVREVYAGDARYSVEGTGYWPTGQFFLQGAHGKAAENPCADPLLTKLMLAGSLCTNARLYSGTTDDAEPSVVGDPTEIALLVLSAKAGLRADGYFKEAEIPFDSNRKMMSVLVRDSAENHTVYSKGAVEAILGACGQERLGNVEVPLDDRRGLWLQRAHELSARALRVLALAYREGGASEGRIEEKDLVFLGLVGMMDPPRSEVADAIQKCKSAGIRPIVITGDHPATALAVAQELGIVGAEANATTGAELDGLNGDELDARVRKTSVYARVSPENKLQIVRALRQQGETVAMTGDGVNDAPAVKAADIGISMGLTGTEVTKEAADMVLVDDNFVSIVNAVEEGRCLFENLQKFVHYLLACNVSEILLVFVAAVLGWPQPLLAIQILWINLVTDGPPALAMAFETPAPDVMVRAPRPVTRAFFDAQIVRDIIGHGLLISAASIIGFWSVLPGPDAGPPEISNARGVAFCVCGFAQLLFAFACRSNRFTALQLGIFSNPVLFFGVVTSVLLQACIVLFPPAQIIFFAHAPDLSPYWLRIACLSFLPLLLAETFKWVSNLRIKKRESRNA